VLTEIYRIVVLIILGSVLIWNQYEYLRVVRTRTGQSFPVIGSSLSGYLVRPWRLFAGFDQLVRVGSARQANPLVEAARQRFLRRRRWVLLAFVVAVGVGIIFIPEIP